MLKNFKQISTEAAYKIAYSCHPKNPKTLQKWRHFEDPNFEDLQNTPVFLQVQNLPLEEYVIVFLGIVIHHLTMAHRIHGTGIFTY